jgi:hypothetical protein
VSSVHSSDVARVQRSLVRLLEDFLKVLDFGDRLLGLHFVPLSTTVGAVVNRTANSTTSLTGRRPTHAGCPKAEVRDLGCLFVQRYSVASVLACMTENCNLSTSDETCTASRFGSFDAGSTSTATHFGGFGFEKPLEGNTNDWLTPLELLKRLGTFDLDPHQTKVSVSQRSFGIE